MTAATETRAALQTTRAADCTARAVTALQAGFASEAGRKEALTWASRAFEAIRDRTLQALLEANPPREDNTREEAATDRYYAMPFDLHQWRAAKHAALFPEVADEIAQLVDLRTAIKAAPVEPKPVREDHPLLVEARAAVGIDLEAPRERRVTQYADALDMGRRLGGLPVSVNRVWCSNYGGTVWVRLDWYLRGERVPFNTIAAAYEQLVREGSIKEPAA